MLNRFHTLLVLAMLTTSVSAASSATFRGLLSDANGKPLAGANVALHSASTGRDYTAISTPEGKFVFGAIPADSYDLTVKSNDREWRAQSRLVVKEASAILASLELTTAGQVVLDQNSSVKDPPSSSASSPAGSQASGGEHLSSSEVSSLPLNVRDFSKLLLLAAGTMTDTNGAANFTQQFAVNGQRGTATVFAMDGFDTTDPEMGGATFSNFHVDAIQEV